MNNRTILIALNHIQGLGPKTIHRLLEKWPTLNDIFKAKLPPPLQEALKNLPWKQVEADMRWSEHPQHHILTCLDKAYPYLLKQTTSSPPVLYLKGDLQVFKKPLLAMVGTRTPTPYGKSVALDWGKYFVRQGLSLVSGLALGIDTCVHTTCLDNQGSTIAVLGSGLDKIYPKKNLALSDKITENGLLISEFSRNLPPSPGQFPRRNRIISGLALCTLVVEAAEKSGSLITAAYAVEQNRDVFAIPGPVGHHVSLGCHRLLQQGARLAAVPDDVLSEYALN